MKVNIPHVVADTDRYGNVRIYYRRKGKTKVRLHEEPGTEEFARELEQAKEKADAEPPRSAAISPASFRALCLDYYKSTPFLQLDARTQRVRRLILDGICQTKAPGGAERGTLPYALMATRHVEEIRDEKIDKPEAANSRVKAMRQLFKWAKKAGRVKHNPAADAGMIYGGGDGFHTWTAEQRTQFETFYPVGTKARLAYAIFAFTGVRRSDAARLGPHMERDGGLQFTETKGSRSKLRRRTDGPKLRTLPILPALRLVLDASRHHGGPFAYLHSDAGAPFKPESLGNWFHDRCKAAGLPEGCSAHGLRKSAATIAAENGATEHQLMAIFGWDSPRQAAVYTRKANRKRMAAEAMHLLDPSRNETGAEVSHFPSGLSVPLEKS